MFLCMLIQYYVSLKNCSFPLNSLSIRQNASCFFGVSQYIRKKYERIHLASNK